MDLIESINSQDQNQNLKDVVDQQYDFYDARMNDGMLVTCPCSWEGLLHGQSETQASPSEIFG